ncbi:MAG: hypothetical protein GXP14_02490 [Gammaproteobacteria bacterium]|nr:hypothetical protein [Gammaproteobacteria bacterium]
MRPSPEYIPASRSTQQNWLICIAIYVLFLLWVEPIIDGLLTWNFIVPEQAQLDLLNKKKRYITDVTFGIARSLPLLLFLWFGWQVFVSQSLPPKKIKMPFAVYRLEGVKVRMYGMLIILLSLVLLFREIHILTATQSFL